MTDTEYVLIDNTMEENYSFDSEEELEEFLEDREYTSSDLDDIQVFKVSKEYRVNIDHDYELEEV